LAYLRFCVPREEQLSFSESDYSAGGFAHHRSKAEAEKNISLKRGLDSSYKDHGSSI
jgi:hypothetical protein